MTGCKTLFLRYTPAFTKSGTPIRAPRAYFLPEVALFHEALALVCQSSRSPCVKAEAQVCPLPQNSLL